MSNVFNEMCYPQSIPHPIVSDERTDASIGPHYQVPVFTYRGTNDIIKIYKLLNKKKSNIQVLV